MACSSDTQELIEVPSGGVLSFLEGFFDYLELCVI